MTNLDSSTSLKNEVREFWNAQSCDTQMARSKKYSLEYFEEIEAFRYFDQPFIHSFAQFSRYHGKKVIEVGFGAGTDLIQWIRAGAIVSGVDLTPEALENATHRIAAYGLPSAEALQVADAENLPFDSGTFDLGYSFGVLHHTPNTLGAIRELVRVVKPGGEIKIMLYNRHSIYILNRWVKFALFRGRPWRSLSSVAANFIESPGTKAYTRNELSKALPSMGLDRIQIQTEAVSGDYLSASALPPLNWIYRLAILLAGETHAWRPEHYTNRPNDPDYQRKVATRSGIGHLAFTGNPLGFYHCITAQKQPQ